jgi:hypothetical protein
LCDKKALKKRLLERYSVQLDEMLEQIEGQKRLQSSDFYGKVLSDNQSSDTKCIFGTFSDSHRLFQLEK